MPDEKPKEQEIQAPKSKLPLKTIIIILGVLLLEAGTISFFFVVKGGQPKNAEATGPIEQTDDNPNKDLTEVVLAEGSVDNYTGGRSKIVVTLEIAAKVQITQKENLDKAVDDHKKEIMNTVRIIVSSAQPVEIKDPKVQVIKKQLHAEMEKIIGEGLIEEILLPVWQTYDSD